MNIARIPGRTLTTVTLLLTLGASVGCETDSFMDPSVVGRWEQTPITLPILSRLDVIEPADAEGLEVTNVRASDLIPDMSEYVMGPGDLLTVIVYELVAPGQESVNTRRVDETGHLRLPVVGAVLAAGKTPTELERDVRATLERRGILRDAQVSVILQTSQQNTFSIIGEPRTGGTAVGTYQIPQPEFRLLDALAMARGVPGRTKRLRIFRQTPLTPEVAGEVTEQPADETEQPAPPAPEDPSQLIEELMQGVDEQPVEPQVDDGEDARPAPTSIEGGLDADRPRGQWVVTPSGEWVKVEPQDAEAYMEGDYDEADELARLMTQRIIEIPYDRLLEGDLRYNVIIRPGDIIRVPDPSAGFVYIMGAISRPGTYTVPGEEDLTLKQLVAAAGNLSQLAIPERVDLIRRVGNNQEAMVRLNLRAIFEGHEPDFFLKPNDTVNVGTSFIATPLAIFRNGLRMTYGFGFILDRNFGSDVFGSTR